MTQSAPDQLPLILIGSGGHARVLLEMLGRLGRRILFLTDRNSARHGQRVDGIEVRGSDEAIFEHAPQAVRLVNAVGSTDVPRARHSVYERFAERGYIFETLVHPSAVIAADVQLGQGAQVMAGAVLQPGVRVGVNTLINTAASIDHDCRIGDHVHVAPGTTISGGVTVGDLTHIGTGATIIQGVKIGREVLVGAGAVVVKDVADGQRIAGVPARQLHRSGTAGAGAGEAFTIMLSAAGRRVALMRLVRESIEQLGCRPRLLATDITRISASLHLADAQRLVPRYRDPHCLDELLRLCREFAVKLIIPTIDPDLPFYAQHREAFEAIGTRIMVSSAETVRIGNDKAATHQWLVDNGFPTVRQGTVQQVLDSPGEWPYPLFVKPRGGSASIGAQLVRDEQELRIATRGGEFIVQEVAPGAEYTVDVYVDQSGRCRCAVPRLRIETRGGEVVKGMTVRNALLEQTASRIAEALPGAWGVMNIQIFYDQASGALNVIEINPRFGGGYPLTHAAGAPMARWVLEELTGRPLTARPDGWTDGLVMLRYDEAVFVSRDDVGLPAVGRAEGATDAHR